MIEYEYEKYIPFWDDQPFLGICIIQEDKLIYVNKRLEETIGLTMDELNKIPLYCWVDPEDRNFSKKQLRLKQKRSIEGVVSRRIVKVVKNKGDIIVFDLFSKTFILNDKPAVLYLFLEKARKVEIEIPEEYKPFLDYIELNFGLKMKDYLKLIIETEIFSRLRDLKDLTPH